MANTGDIGKTIGNYRLVAEIGSGAFGIVYRCEHAFLSNRIGAMKLMHATHLDSWKDRESFLLEARLLEMLKHPHILPIMDVGIHEGFPYLVTEYAPHGSLRDLMQHRYPNLIPPPEAVRIIVEIGEALNHAHQQNIIHRDLKPANILFNSKSEALLADFGIATTLATASIKFVDASGSPAYMAPEQFQGTVSKESDQYSLACIAYELFTGRRPFDAPDPFTLGFKHLMEMPVPPSHFNPQIPPYVEQAVLKALAKQRADRYPDIQAFITALQGAPASIAPGMFTGTIDDGHTLSAQKLPLVMPPLSSSSAEDTAKKLAPLPAAQERGLTLPTIAAGSGALTGAGIAEENIPTMRAQNSPGNGGAAIISGPITPAPLPLGYNPETPQPVFPVTYQIAPVVPPNAPVAPARRRRRPLLLAAILAILLLLLVPGVLAAYYTFAYPGTATVTITPQHKELSNSFTITQITGTSPDIAQQQVGGARLVTSTQSKTTQANATGVQHTSATYAGGSLTIVNSTTGAFYVYAHGSVKGKSGITVVTTNSYQVYVGPGQSVTLGAYASTAGTSGNIPARDVDISQASNGGTVHVYNASGFSGGRNAGTYSVVQQSDIDGAANPLLAPLTSSAQQDIQGQALKNERFADQPQCATKVSHDANVNDNVSSFNVTVTATCTAEVYDPQAPQKLATDLLTKQGATDLDPSYQVANIVTAIQRISITDAKKGILSILVLAEGVWNYRFSASQERALAQVINGKSQQDAQTTLASQQGIASTSVSLAGGFLFWNHVPTDLGHIYYTEKNVAAPQLQISPTPTASHTTATPGPGSPTP